MIYSRTQGLVNIVTTGLIFNTKYSYWFSNAIGLVKVCTLLFIIITGWVILGGETRVENPKSHFQDAWSGSSTATAYGFTIALYRIIFSYGGYNNAFNVVNEVKVCRDLYLCIRDTGKKWLILVLHL
jgi:amino acid transporter